VLFKNATGGSTGEPVNFFQDRAFRELSFGSRLRAWSWSGFQPGDRVAWIWGAPQETSQAAKLIGRAIWRLDNRRLFDAFSAGPAQMHGWSAALLAFRPSFVVGYASAPEAFARSVLTDRLPLPASIRAVFSTAEQLLPAQRALIEQAFACPVRDQYGSREVQSIAAECSFGRMHLASDVVHVEFVPTADPVPGNLARIVVTPLFASGMPLIRYVLGDLGAPVNGQCPCGLPYPLMRLGIGRTSDVFVTPEGTLVHGEYFTHLLYGAEGIGRFQFEQVAPHLVKLRIIANGGFGAATRQLLSRVQERVHADVSPQMRIVWELVGEIPVTPTGKFRFTRSSLGAQVLEEKTE
jgi:phenylacetate-CoA ligase